MSLPKPDPLPPSQKEHGFVYVLLDGEIDPEVDDKGRKKHGTGRKFRVWQRHEGDLAIRIAGKGTWVLTMADLATMCADGLLEHLRRRG